MLVQDSLPRTRFDLGSQEVRVSHCFIQRKQPCFSGRASLELAAPALVQFNKPMNTRGM
jgi:hypothetical protein